MNYANWIKLDVANTKGISTTLFVSGCTHNCEGCFNKEQQNFNYGKLYTKEFEEEFISFSKDENIECIAILGGEPFQQDENLLILLKRLKEEVKKPIWVWSGFCFEEILENPDRRKLLDCIDILIDGKFELKNRDLKLKYRGSSNQRVIDVYNSLMKNKIITIV